MHYFTALEVYEGSILNEITAIHDHDLLVLRADYVDTYLREPDIIYALPGKGVFGCSYTIGHYAGAAWNLNN